MLTEHAMKNEDLEITTVPQHSAAHLNAREYKHEFHIMSLLQQKNLIHFTIARKRAKCDDL